MTSLDCIKYNYHTDKDMIENALEIVKNFIIQRKYILVGGQAIDYALRLKGDELYDECTVPDYDFLAIDSIEAAYDLGEILSKKYDDISVINALHPSTMRVRVQFIVVADITYCPDNVFKQVPTLNYKRINVIHPLFQRIDMHNSLCNPYDNPPRENIFNRWEKDLKRRAMLDKHYPIKLVKDDKAKLDGATIELEELKDSLITGFLAYYILMKQYKIVTSLMPKVEIVGTTITCNYPITLVRDTDDSLFEKGFDHYNSWLEKRPDMWKLKGFELYNNAHKAVSKEDISIKINGKEHTFVVANNEHVLKYFLTRYFEEDNKIYLDYYENLYKLSEQMPLSTNVFKSSKDFTNVEFSKRRIYNNIYNKKENTRPSSFFPPKERPNKFDPASFKLDGRQN